MMNVSEIENGSTKIKFITICVLFAKCARNYIGYNLLNNENYFNQIRQNIKTWIAVLVH